jgi:hypothetical protein
MCDRYTHTTCAHTHHGIHSRSRSHTLHTLSHAAPALTQWPNAHAAHALTQCTRSHTLQVLLGSNSFDGLETYYLPYLQNRRTHRVPSPVYNEQMQTKFGAR